MTIDTVVLVGGTHGNELTGIHLLQHWQTQTSDIQRPSFQTEWLFANPQANQQMKRYLDQDLNRQFALADLHNPERDNYEQCRAKVINQQLGPKEHPRVDFVIDLHTTTANMGLTLVIADDSPLVIGMAFYIKQQLPQTQLFFEPKDRLEDNFLTSMGRLNGLLIEVGPCPQGLLRADSYQLTREACRHALDYLHLYNCQQLPPLPDQHDAFQFVTSLFLPVNAEGQRQGMVHPDAQDKDYQLLREGDPLFMTFSGDTLAYHGPDRYLAFVNEAAYYDRNIGVSLMDKIVLHRPDFD